MPIPRAKSPRQLYREVCSYDRVITPDGPLASAINRQLDRPHLGPFAIPPRRLAAGRREESEDRLAFLDIIADEDLSWKRCAYAVGNILQCWEHQASHDSIFEYDAYVDEATTRAVERIAELDTASMKLTTETIDPAHDLVVIEPAMLTQLEQSYLPAEYDTVSLFTNEAFEMSPVRIHDSPTAIVETVVDAVTVETAETVGIVLNQESEYSPLIESALESAEIPFFGGPGFTDQRDHRAFLQFLRTAYRGTDTRLNQIRSLLTALDCGLPDRDMNKRLYELDTGDLSWLKTVCHNIHEYTFAEALEAFECQVDTTLETFHEELTTLGIADELLTEHRLNELVYYLQTYEVPVSRENEGVLLADAKSASYVGRDIVFYLGLDEGWTRVAPRRPWVDQDAQFTRNLASFQLLLQSGSQQHYLVQDAAGGAPVTPSLYFEELLDTDIDRFRDLPSTTHQPATTDQDAAGFQRQPTDITPEPIDTISKSSLNTYVNSPRDYYFSRVVKSPEKAHLTEGTLLHDFAEFYATHPEVVNETTLTEIVELLIEHIRPLVRAVDEQTRRTEYRASLETIMSYLDANPPTDGTFLTPSSGGHNVIADHFEMPVDTPVTERRFIDRDRQINGMIDLVESPRELLDYKSGSDDTARTIVNNAAVDEPTDTPDFQAPLYLTYWRSQIPDEELSFTFFYVTELIDDIITGGADLEDALTTLTYYPESSTDHIRQEAFFEYLRKHGSNKCQKILSKIEYPTYEALFDAASFVETTDSDELIESTFGQTMIKRLKAEIGEYKYVTTGSKQAMRSMTDRQQSAFFEPDLDTFEDFIEAQLTELNARRTGAEPFPITGLHGEINYRRVDNRDLLLEGDR